MSLTKTMQCSDCNQEREFSLIGVVCGGQVEVYECRNCQSVPHQIKQEIRKVLDAYADGVECEP